MNQSQMFSRNEVAKRLGVSVGKIDKLLASGELPRISIGARVLIASEDLAAFIEANRRSAKSPRKRLAKAV